MKQPLLSAPVMILSITLSDISAALPNARQLRRPLASSHNGRFPFNYDES